MRVVVYEAVTGGGLTVPESETGIVREADLMVRALIRDLTDAPGVEVAAARRPDLAPLPGVEQIVPFPDEPPYPLYRRALASADAGWPIAPETDGVLEDLARQTLELGKTLLGSPPEAVRVAASKQATADALREAGVPVVQTFSRAVEIPDLAGPFVVKPDDGAGSAGIRLVASAHGARDALDDGPGRLVAQPWLEGEPLSLSLVCQEGCALLLACNRQRIRIRDSRISLAGIGVNAACDRMVEFGELAAGVAAAMPALRGYVGVDLVWTRGGPVVLEVNPRLTTSYCGLREAVGVNVAEIILDLARGGALSGWRLPTLGGHVVELELEPAGG